LEVLKAQKISGPQGQRLKAGAAKLDTGKRNFC
jgi:hypothetical protein